MTDRRGPGGAKGGNPLGAGEVGDYDQGDKQAAEHYYGDGVPARKGDRCVRRRVVAAARAAGEGYFTTMSDPARAGGQPDAMAGLKPDPEV